MFDKRRNDQVYKKLALPIISIHALINVILIVMYLLCICFR